VEVARWGIGAFSHASAGSKLTVITKDMKVNVCDILAIVTVMALHVAKW